VATPARYSPVSLRRRVWKYEVVVGETKLLAR
jgi:hypothetical protein